MHRFSVIASLTFFWVVGYGQSPDKCPCSKSEYRQFDFWLGEWETFTNNSLAGTNRVVLLQDSCLLQENWLSANRNYSGTSYNFYDPQDQKWHQTWIDNQGQGLRLEGGLEKGNMVMRSGPMKNRQGDLVYHRITWTPNPDGTVRQLWESSPDGSTDWQSVFDGLYKKKEHPK